MPRRLLGLVGLAIVVIVVVSLLVWGDDDESRAVRRASGTAPKADASRDCRTHIEGRLPPADPRMDLTVGPVRFRDFRFASRFAAREQGRGFFEIRNGEYHQLKFVTEVSAGADVTVAIGLESRETAGLLYGGDTKYGRFGIRFDEGEQAVRFRACSADHPAGSARFYRRRTVGPWTQFNGGFILTERQCLRLDVYVRGRAVQRFAEPFGRTRSGCGVRPTS